MLEILILILSLIGGIALGVVFFGGLWWTVRKGLTLKQPAFLFLGSLWLRTAIALLGFYYISGGNWKRLVACLLGFVAARLIVTVRTRTSGKARIDTNSEAGYAS